jgi:hypothetical protein
LRTFLDSSTLTPWIFTLLLSPSPTHHPWRGPLPQAHNALLGSHITKDLERPLAVCTQYVCVCVFLQFKKLCVCVCVCVVVGGGRAWGGCVCVCGYTRGGYTCCTMRNPRCVGSTPSNDNPALPSSPGRCGVYVRMRVCKLCMRAKCVYVCMFVNCAC